MKGSTIALLSFGAGLVAGGVIVMYLRPSAEAVGAVGVAEAAGVAEGRSTAAQRGPNLGTERRVEAELAQLRRENEALAEQLSVFEAERSETEAGREERRENIVRMRSFFADRMEAQQQARIAHDREYFRLTPYQEDRLNAWVGEQADLMNARQEIMQQVRAGQITREEAQRQIGQLEAGSVSYEEALKSVLTGEQLTGFEDYEAQLDHNRREARAYEQLGELARTLVLSEQQKDALLEVFYTQAPPTELRDLPREERRAAWQQYQESELQRLQSILTPEQLQLYETRRPRGRD